MLKPSTRESLQIKRRAVRQQKIVLDTFFANGHVG
jgi:hypothetical protein